MFALVAAAAQHTQELFLKNGMSEAAIRDHEIQKNSDMIDFCTTTYSSIRNREYCIDVSCCRAPPGRPWACAEHAARGTWRAVLAATRGRLQRRRRARALAHRSCVCACCLHAARLCACLARAARRDGAARVRQKFVKPNFNYLNM